MSVSRRTLVNEDHRFPDLIGIKVIIMSTLVLKVDNLKCDGCSSTVRRRVPELPDVAMVLVDPVAGSMRVEHDGSTMPSPPC